MIDMISGAFSGLKTAAELTQGLLALKTDAAVSTKVVELNGVISGIQQQLFAAQADYSALTSRIRDLEAEIVDFKNWEEEKQRYELHELAPGTLVYRVKPEVKGAEPVHYLCTNCYQQRIKAILQYSGYSKGHKSFTCPSCKMMLLIKEPESESFIELTATQWDFDRGF